MRGTETQNLYYKHLKNSLCFCASVFNRLLTHLYCFYRHLIFKYQRPILYINNNRLVFIDILTQNFFREFI